MVRRAARTEDIMATDIVIASAARTPVGSFNGAFSAVPAHDLGNGDVAQVVLQNFAWMCRIENHVLHL